MARKKKSTQPRYLDVKIPDVNPGEEELYKEFSTRQRRAVISRLILDTGHPRSVSQTALSKQFGIAQQTISKDFKIVMPQIINILKREGELVIHSVMNKAIRDCVKGNNADKYKAAQLAKNYHDMLLDSGEIERAPTETINTDIDWSAAYDQAQKEKEEENNDQEDL